MTSATPQPVVLPGDYTVAAGVGNIDTNLPAAHYPRSLAWCTDRTPIAGYMVSTLVSGTWVWRSSGSGVLVNSARPTTATDGTYTWVYATPYPSGVIPNVQALVQATSGTTDVINVQLDGAPTNTQAKFRVTRTQLSVVALLGLTILSIPGTIGAQVLNLRAEA